MRGRYFSMWRLHLKQEQRERDLESEGRSRLENEMRRRILVTMRGALKRQRQLHDAERHVKSGREIRVLSQVMRTMSGLREVRATRLQALESVMVKTYRRTLLEGFNRVCRFGYHKTISQASVEWGRNRLARKGLTGLKKYQARKAKEDNDFRLARKFRYLTLIQRGTKAFK
jgi:hypothetical protein